MEKPWIDPSKRPASAATLNMTADWNEFADLMKRIIAAPEEKKAVVSSSPAPDAS
jgi:hypothetical protein